jgi:SnoaL-like domain
MSFLGSSGIRGTTFGRAVLASAALALAVSARPALAEYPVTTLATLLDRAQIEDMLVNYYENFGITDSHFGSYYLADGVLDVNGLVARGERQIEELYKRTAEGTPRRPGRFHMLLTNPRIRVSGDTATADVVWTGIISDTPQSTPHFVEQGREHDELVKRSGRWYFKYRAITSDGGMPAMFEKSYKNR